MPRKKTAVTSAERRHTADVWYKAQRISLISGNFNTLMRYGAIVAVFFFVWKCADSLAGRITIADVGVKVLGNIRVSEALAWIFGGGGVYYGRRQNRLRQNDVERLAARVKELEGRLDRRRTSSKLTPRGETHPGDRI